MTEQTACTLLVSMAMHEMMDCFSQMPVGWGRYGRLDWMRIRLLPHLALSCNFRWTENLANLCKMEPWIGIIFRQICPPPYLSKSQHCWNFSLGQGGDISRLFSTLDKVLTSFWVNFPGRIRVYSPWKFTKPLPEYFYCQENSVRILWVSFSQLKTTITHLFPLHSI